MYIALFLHLYQPPTQDPAVTFEITKRSYVRLAELLCQYPQARVTVNLTGSLLEQWMELANSYGSSSNENFRPAELESASAADRSGRSRSLRSSPAPLTFSNSPRSENFVASASKAGSHSLTRKDSYSSPEVYRQVLAGFQELYQRGQIELTGTAMYHPLLPTLPAAEVVRQIELDLAIKRAVFGERLKPAGFFPPEMVYTDDIARIVAGMGFEWIVLDESAHPLSSVRRETPAEHAALHLGDTIYQVKDTNLKVFFRDREASLKVAFSDRLTLDKFFSEGHFANQPELRGSSFQSATRSAQGFGKVSNPPTHQPTNYFLLALDGETFGHHRPGMWGWLTELFRLTADDVGAQRAAPAHRANQPELRGSSFRSATRSAQGFGTVPSGSSAYDLSTLSELLQKGYQVRTIDPVTSTWGVTIEEPDQSRTFPRWQNTGNPVHKLQWELYELALEVGERLPVDLKIADGSGGWKIEDRKEYRSSQAKKEDHSENRSDVRKARELLDRGLHSDQFWWGSAAPCWNLSMVEKGAVLLRDSVLANPKASEHEKDKAEYYFGEILKVGRAEFGEEVVGC